MKWVFIIGFHVCAIFLLWLLGLQLDGVGGSHPGVSLVFSAAWAVYTTGLNLLYHKNRTFYLFVNRMLLRLSRTHTYWQPSFDLETPPRTPEEQATLLNNLWDLLREGKHGKVEKRDQTPSTLAVGIDDLFVLIIRIEETTVNVHLDRKLLVPSHLYDSFRQRLSLLAEAISNAANPVRMRCSLVLSFGDGTHNPYYGFFVNRVPPDLLQDFQVSFLLNRNSTCRIEATTDRVSIEGRNLTELFEATNQVLNLRAVPDGVT